MSRNVKNQRQRLLRETRRVLRGKVVVVSHLDVLVLAEVRRGLAGNRGARTVRDLLGSLLRALCWRESVQVGGVLYVRSDEIVKVR